MRQPLTLVRFYFEALWGTHRNTQSQRNTSLALIYSIFIIEGYMFEIEDQFYQENRETIREKYKGKAVAIVGEMVLIAGDWTLL